MNSIRKLGYARISLIALAGAFASPQAAFAQAANGGSTPTTTGEVCNQDTAFKDVACGKNSTAQGILGGGSSAFGYNAAATGTASTAIGIDSAAKGPGDIAIGPSATASGGIGVAIGNGAAATGFGIGIGGSSFGFGFGGIAIGTEATTKVSSGSQTDGNIAIGSSSGAAGASFGGTLTTANGGYSTALGTAAQATGKDAVSLGAFSVASGLGSIAIGRDASATGANSVAIGNQSSDGGADNVVSVGFVGGDRRIINVADGISGTDAVNLSQLNAAIAGVSGAGPLAVQYDTAAKDVITFHSGGTPTKLSNVANGVAAGDAVNKGQLDAVGTTANTALSTANTAVTTANTALATANTALNNTKYVVVSGNGAVPVVSGTGAVGIGIGQTANGNGAVAIGDPNTATGTGAVAVGANNTASGNGAVAVGNGNTANGNGAVALGNGANAGHANAVALGSGSASTRANQVVLGGTGSSVTVGDIAASTAAQAGPVDVATVDAAGTLGRDTTIRPAITALQASVATHNSAIAAIQALDTQQTAQINTLFDMVNHNRDEARRGIAAAVAMASAPFPSEPGKVSYAANTAVYHGQWAFSASLSYRIPGDTAFAITAGVSHSGGNDTAARFGVAGEF